MTEIPLQRCIFDWTELDEPGHSPMELINDESIGTIYVCLHCLARGNWFV